MSTIFGQYGNVQADLIKKMPSQMEKKYLDGVRFYKDNSIMLGQGITKIGEDYCPGVLHNEDGTIALLVDGRIFNSQHLRTLLKKKHSFSTDFSGEVLVHLYEEYGCSFFDKLLGDFSFCLYDPRIDRLILCVDSAASRPLFYHLSNKGIIFSSSIFPLFSHLKKRELNEKALREFFTYFLVPGPQTLINGISRVMPGHYIICDKGTVCAQRYHEPKESIENRNEEFFVKKLRSFLTEAIINRCQPNVPIHAALGGLDSGSIIGIMRKRSMEVNTYTIGFEGADDELGRSREIAEFQGTNHTEIFIEEEDISSYYRRILPRMNQPSVMDCVSLVISPIFKRIKNSRFHYFNGEGGCMVLGGRKNEQMLFDYYFRSLPIPLRHPLNSLIHLLNHGAHYWNHWRRDTGLSPIADFKYASLEPNLLKSYRRLTAGVTDDFFKDPGRGSLELYHQYFFDRRYHFLNRLLKLNTEMKCYLDQIALSENLCNMKGTNNCSPFIDRQLVDFSFTIPIQYKYKRGAYKELLIKATRDLFRRPMVKTHFTNPFLDHLGNYLFERKGILDEMTRTSRAFASIRKCSIDTLWKKRKTRNFPDRARATYQLHAIYSLGIWYERHFNDTLIAK